MSGRRLILDLPGLPRRLRRRARSGSSSSPTTSASTVVAALPVAGAPIPIADYDGIDAASSPLKLRGCFRIDPVAVVRLPVAPDATPLVAPFWFRCFDARALTRDLAAGAATAHLVSRDTPEGFDLMIAVYPDGRGYLWRQLNARFE